MNYSMPGFPVLHYLQSLLKLMSIESVMPANHLILCLPLLLLPSIFPSIKVFSSESALRIRWPKYWSFSFSVSTSKEHSGLISFRVDWFDLLAVQGTLESFPIPQFEGISFLVLSLLYGPTQGSSKVLLPLSGPRACNPFNEYSELISFRLDSFDLFAVQGTCECLHQYHSLKV